MLSYALRRILIVVITLLAASVIVFAVLEIVPGDPARLMLGINATEDAVHAFELIVQVSQERLEVRVPAADLLEVRVLTASSRLEVFEEHPLGLASGRRRSMFLRH